MIAVGNVPVCARVPESFIAASFEAQIQWEDGAIEHGLVLAWLHKEQPLAVHYVDTGRIRISHTITGRSTTIDLDSWEEAFVSCERLARACDWHGLTYENSMNSPQHEAVRNERERLGR